MVRQEAAGSKSESWTMNDRLDAAKLTDRVAALVEAAKRAGADAADAVVVRGRSTSVSVRLGKVEDTGAAEAEDVPGVARDPRRRRRRVRRSRR